MTVVHKIAEPLAADGTSPAGVEAPRQTSPLDRLVETMTQVSKLGGLATGAGMLVLYLSGISLYIVGSALFGVEPFEFELRGCLEAGTLAVSRLIVSAPLLVVLGVPRLARGGAAPLLVALGLLLVAGLLVRRCRGHLAALVISCLFLQCLFVLTRGYMANLFLLTSRNLLTSPAVSQSIERLAGGGLTAVEQAKAGNLGPSILFRTESETLGALSDLVVWYAASLGVVIATWKLLARCRAILPAGNRLLRLLRWESGALGVGSVLYLVVGVTFWLPASLLLVQATGMHKVDVSIAGLEELTSKVYLVQYAEYRDSYVFYVPTQQSVLRVAKQNVRYLLQKGGVSPFSNRALFIKGPWLGIEYLPTWVDAAKARKGLGILRLSAASPADRAGLLPGDIALSLNGTPLQDPEGLAGALKAAPLDRRSELVFLRKGKVKKTTAQVELRP